jgi:hypothetical protein
MARTRRNLPGAALRPATANANQPRVRTCPECGAKFGTKAALHAHMLAVHHAPTANLPVTTRPNAQPHKLPYTTGGALAIEPVGRSGGPL